jgi:acyl dehydratase
MSVGPSGVGLRMGSYEAARAMIGTRVDVEFADHEVTWALIKYFCAMVRDSNASYWDADFAQTHWGGVVSPPAMLLTWVMAPVWHPEASAPKTMLLAQVPLPDPTVISVETDTELFRPILVGDRLNVEETLIDVTARKSTALGDGHFVTTESVYRLGDGTMVARYRHVLFRYTPARAQGAT